MKATIPHRIVSPLPQLAAAGQALLARVRIYRSRMRERAYLAQMTERDLRDVGLSRMDQIMLVDKPFWRE